MHGRLCCTLISTIVVTALAWCAPIALAQAAVTRFDLPAQPLAESLRAVGSQAKVNVLFDPPLVADHQAPVLKGEFTSNQAFTLLLEGTGITHEFMNDRTIVLVAAAGPMGFLHELSGASDFTRASTAALPLGASVSSSSLWNRFRLAQADSSSGGGMAVSQAEQGAAGSVEVEVDLATRPLEEIIVTAQKREERLKDVPISISVLSGDDLDGSTTQGVTEALNRVPGVAATLAVNGGGTQVAVRGVSASGPLFNGSSPVAYYLDSVPFGLVKTAIIPDANAFDLARVEILRGPQGTLYGANAQNGVVRVLTRDADLNEIELKTRALISSTEGGAENYRGDLAVNIPLIADKVAARAVVGFQDLSGWIDRPTGENVNDARLRNARLKINAQPTDELSVGLSAWVRRDDFGAPSVSAENDQHSTLVNEAIDTDYDTYGLKVGYEFASFSIASMTSYLDYQNQGSVGLEFFGSVPLSTRLDADVFAEEVILNSAPDSSWRWSLGGFYRDAEDRLRQNSLDPLLAPFDYANGSESYAAFGEIGRRFADEKLDLTLGLRYFHDNVSVKENINQGPPGSLPVDEHDSFDSTTPRAVLTWYPNSDVTVYTSYAEGFRSGFPQDPGVVRSNPDFPAVEPDKLHNYEIGAKAELFDERLFVDSALYYVNWDDVQQTISVVFGGTIVTAPINGESASGFGVDLGLTARPFDGLELAVNVGWNDLTMDAAVVLPGGVVMFEEGDRLNLSPEYTAGASADYSFLLGSFRGRFSASANYISEQTQRSAFGPIALSASGDEMLLARASFSVEAAERWTATLFADNINNERDAALRSPLFAFGAVDWSLRARPRTIGVQFEYQFGR